MKTFRVVLIFALTWGLAHAFLAFQRGWVGHCHHAVLGAFQGGDDRSSSSSTENNEWKNFNPFDPSTMKSSSAAASVAANQISLRKTQMQELMSNLLNSAGDEAATTTLLEESRDLLLEPLEDDDAVLEKDSIYKPNMTRQERYATYRATMQERMQSARNSNVRAVLQKLSEYVLANE